MYQVSDLQIGNFYDNEGGVPGSGMFLTSRFRWWHVADMSITRTILRYAQTDKTS